MSGLTEEQRKLYDKLQDAITNKGNVAELLKGISKDNLLKVLTAADIHEQSSDGVEHTLTPLGFAICSKNQEVVKVILDAAKEHNILKEVLTTAHIIWKSDGREDIFTPLGLAICSRNQEVVKVILDAAKEHNILKEVLTTAHIIRKSDGREDIFTPLGLAIRSKNQEVVKVILDAAKEQDILKEVLVGMGKDDRERIKGLLDGAEDRDMLDKILQVEKIIESEAVKANPSSNENVEQLKNIAKTTNKPIKTGIACGVIAGLAVGVGCFAFGVALPILAIAGIALASALLVGLIAGGITYAVSKPSSKVEKADTQKQNLLEVKA